MPGYSGHGAGLFAYTSGTAWTASTRTDPGNTVRGLPASRNWLKVGRTRDITGPALSTNDVDVTNNDSEDHFKEYIAGLIEPGETSFDIVLDPSDPTHTGASNSLLAWELDRLVRHWRLLLPIEGSNADVTPSPLDPANTSGIYTVAEGIRDSDVVANWSAAAGIDTFVQFDGFVKNFEITTPMEEAIMASITIRTTGRVFFYPSS